jgi:hypothetical protein
MEQLVQAVSFIEAGRWRKDRVVGLIKRVRCKWQTSNDNSLSAIAIGYKQKVSEMLHVATVIQQHPISNSYSAVADWRPALANQQQLLDHKTAIAGTGKPHKNQDFD